MSANIDDRKLVEMYQQEKRLRALKWKLMFYPTRKDIAYTIVGGEVVYENPEPAR